MGGYANEPRFLDPHLTSKGAHCQTAKSNVVNRNTATPTNPPQKRSMDVLAAAGTLSAPNALANATKMEYVASAIIRACTYHTLDFSSEASQH